MSAAPGRSHSAQREGIPMNYCLVEAASVPPQPWRNGGGQTRELLAWPTPGQWKLRISRADIDADGPFSAFEQVERWFAVLRGNGVALSFAGAPRELRVGDAPLCFDGAAAPGCRLLDGPTQDLNLMLRQGSGVMRQVHAGHDWSETFALRALYTTLGGQWSDGRQSCAIGADSLLWSQHDGAPAWRFVPDDADAPTSAWWLGYNPRE